VTTVARGKGKGAVERITYARGKSPALAAIGLEAEFSVVVDGREAKPEHVFGSPTRIVRGPMMHRTGRSYHLPTGGAIYFDTGVIEIATPLIEIERGCAARAGRSLWESIRFLRQELDAWEERESRTVHLSGFSTHYNVSFEIPPHERGVERSVGKLAVLLTHIIPVPMMLLAANRRSTGIGVRPRGDRVEITADFTPDASLMIAAATLVVGIVREVMQWKTFELGALAAHRVHTPADFTPEKHSSRKGWVARYTSFAENPFVCDVNAKMWRTRAGERVSLRQLGRSITRRFWPSIARLGDPRSLRLIRAVMSGRTPSLLELEDRPAAYDSVGHLCTWANLFPIRALPRSKYERVFIHAISGRQLRLGRDWYSPVGMEGWSRVVFERERDRSRHVFSLDFLMSRLNEWDLGPTAERRLRRTLRDRLQRRA
jgi:hypothetical protein